MPTLTITSLTGSTVPLTDFYGDVKSGTPVVAWRASSDLPRMVDTLTRWKNGEISIDFVFTPEEIFALGETPTRRELNSWARDNVAASLTNDPMLPPELASAAFAEKLMTTGGVVIGIKAQLSEAPAGSALVLTVSKNGVASAASMLIAIAGDLDNVFMLPTPLVYEEGDKLGMMLTTTGAWTSLNLDVLAGLILIDNAPSI